MQFFRIADHRRWHCAADVRRAAHGVAYLAICEKTYVDHIGDYETTSDKPSSGICGKCTAVLKKQTKKQLIP